MQDSCRIVEGLEGRTGSQAERKTGSGRGGGPEMVVLLLVELLLVELAIVARQLVALVLWQSWRGSCCGRGGGWPSLFGGRRGPTRYPRGIGGSS